MESIRSAEARLLAYARPWRGRVQDNDCSARRTIPALARELGLSPAVCRSALSRLVDRGLIEVRIHPGARLEILAVQPDPD